HVERSVVPSSGPSLARNASTSAGGASAHSADPGNDFAATSARKHFSARRRSSRTASCLAARSPQARAWRGGWLDSPQMSEVKRKIASESRQASRFDPEWPFEIGRGGNIANSNLGNGNLRPETFGKTRQELPHVDVEGSAETGPWRGKLLKCRAILWRRKSCQDVLTSWWS